MTQISYENAVAMARQASSAFRRNSAAKRQGLDAVAKAEYKMGVDALKRAEEMCIANGYSFSKVIYDAQKKE